MTKVPRIAILAVTAASSAWSQDLHDPNAASLSPDVEQRLAELRQHGDRFEKAIRLMEAEAQKPAWGWADCGHDLDHVPTLSPDS